MIKLRCCHKSKQLNNTDFQVNKIYYYDKGNSLVSYKCVHIYPTNNVMLVELCSERANSINPDVLYLTEHSSYHLKKLYANKEHLEVILGKRKSRLEAKQIIEESMEAFTDEQIEQILKISTNKSNLFKKIINLFI